MGFDVSFNNNTKVNTLTNSKNDINISMDGNKTTMESVLLDNVNYIKLRDLEKLGFKVNYNSDTREITISKN
jgi:hypothetical protein